MEGYEVINEQGQRAWWDGKRITPIKPTATTAEQQLAEDNPAFSKGLEALLSEVTQGAGSMAELSPGGLVGGAAQIFNAPFAGAGETAGTATQNLLARVPGLGGAGGVVPAAGGALANAVTQVGTGQALMTPLIRGAAKVFGRVVAPAATRTAAGEAALEKTGATGNMIKRAYELPESKAAYAAAEAQPPLPAAGLAREFRTAEQSASKSIQARPARRMIRETADILHPPIKVPEVPGAPNMGAYLAGKQKAADELAEAFRQRPSTVSWKQAIDHVQNMRNSAMELYDRGLNIGGKTLSDASEKVMNKLSSVSSEYATANKLYNREQSINRVAEIFTKPGPSSKLGLLFQKDKMTKAAFSLDEAKMFEKMARFMDTIGATGSPFHGPAARIFDAASSPLSALIRSRGGMAIMRQVFKGGITPNAISTAGQLIAASQSHNGE